MDIRLNSYTRQVPVLRTLYKRIGYAIIPKPHLSSREGINSRCRHFVAFRRYERCCRRSCCRWRSIDRDRRYAPFRRVLACSLIARISVFAIVLGAFRE